MIIRSSHWDGFTKYVIIFQEQPFDNFPGGSICLSNRHFQEGLSVRLTDLLSNRTDTNFPRNPYQVLEHIRVFQEPLFSHRTDIHFPGSPVVLKHILFSRRPLCLEQIGIFQKGTPRRTDISAIGLGGCFRIMMIRRDRKTFVNEMNKVSFFILTSLTNNAKKF